MAIPVNIEDLVHGKTVEWERLEFKKGWNPEDVIHSMCAFANDLNNWGGGYIIIGINENKGQPVFPPKGVAQNELDNLQGEVLKLAHKIIPNYFPVMQPAILQEKHIFILWCPAGDNRPYSAPSTLGKNGQRYQYIRYGSRSIIAKGNNLQRLNELTARIPFDDRVNNQATVNDLDLGLIRSYLQEIKSNLFEESKDISLTDLARQMRIAKGANEELHPVNAGLLFFTKNPEKYFQRCWIELVWHKDTSGRNFTEKTFKGPLHIQLRSVLDFIQNNIIKETVTKLPGKAEAQRIRNFPFAAVEEAVSNAVYHKSYELANPIEIQVWDDKIEIFSFPGPVPPVDAKILREKRRIVARDYRNRRIGDFLKELRLTEGRGTGFPTIYNAMKVNGSPKPVFETDEESTYFLTILPANNQATTQANDQDKELVFNTLHDILVYCAQDSDQVSDQVSDGVRNHVKYLVRSTVHSKVADILKLFITPKKRSDLFDMLGMTNHSTNRKKYLDPLIKYGWVEMKYPNKKTSPNQVYTTTPSGKKLLSLLTSNTPDKK
jgi:ATP-dependent DNA helicase RecG